MVYKSYLRNSLDMVFLDSDIKSDDLDYTAILKNECFSFQVAVWAENEQEEANGWNDVAELRVEVESDIQSNVYIVENIPAMRLSNSICDDWVERSTPGLYPDCLTNNEKNFFSLPIKLWRSIWVNINEDKQSVEAGEYVVKIKIYDRKTEQLVIEKQITLEVISAMLPKQKIITTNWLHYDCMAFFSNTKPFTDDFFKVAESYINLAAKNGQNMVLLPAFTPPLDTPVGEERETVQLVQIELKDGEYKFDFLFMEKFMKLCMECGIEYFEHSHLFTQWGAKAAPKIIVKVNGIDEKRFGWHTDAQSDEYKDFLRAYLRALKIFLKEKGYEKRFFFHVSDEPEMKNIESYKSASNLVHEELSEYPNGDALAEYKFYEDGLVQTPIVAIRHIEEFIGKANPLWLYNIGYDCSEYLPNRNIGMSQERGRVFGAQLYYFDIKGFLHWGFNAHHNRLSRKIVNPRISSTMEGDFASGTSYLVYPDESKADASIRLMTFRDEMQDIRAFELLESMKGRTYVKELIAKYIPDISFHCKVTKKQLLDLRNKVNEEIKICI